MNIVVAQFWSKNLSYTGFTKAINQKYCGELGYTYYIEDNDEKIIKSIEGRAFTWYKPKLLLEVLEKYNPEYVFFLDADAIFCNNSYRIEDFICEKNDCVVTLDHGPSRMNAGVLLFKNSEWSKKFLNRWWEVSNELSGPNGERKGHYHNGLWHDQTCFGHLYDNEGYSSKIKIIDNKILNGRTFRNVEDKNFIFHAFSYGLHKNRTLDLAYYKIFNIPIPESENILDIVHLYMTDKHYEHDYFRLIYDKIFRPLKRVCKKIIEIGVGDLESIKLWRDYFTNSIVIGVDKKAKEYPNNRQRIELLKLDQSKEEDMAELSTLHQEVDIIIDDGSHKMKEQQISLAKLFKSLKSNGIYIIEDLHTSIEAKMPEKSWCDWGDKEKTTTLDMLIEYQNNKEVKSDYMSLEDINYLNNNIESVEIYRSNPNYSIIGIIKKK